MIIDIFTKREVAGVSQREDSKEDPAGASAELCGVTNEQRVTQYREQWQACRHHHMVFDDEQRTIQCSDCNMWLDPFWAFKELWRYYDQRVDQRLELIREFEQRERARQERASKRKQQPRRALINRRAETAERAAYNEYQSKILAARAERQRTMIEKLDAQIDAVAEPAQEPGAEDAEGRA